MELQLTEQEQEVRTLFTDPQSLTLFDMRVAFNHTGDYQLINDGCFALYQAHTGTDLRALLHANKRPLVLFGAGGYGWSMWLSLKTEGIATTCFADNSPQKQGTQFCGHPVISPQQAWEQYPDALVLVTVTSGGDSVPMAKQMREIGFAPEQILEICQGFGNQYFDCPQMELGSNEIFVDVGSLNAADCLEFAKVCGGKYRRILVFEPDARNYERCRKNLEDVHDCEFYQLGLWDKRETLRFTSNEGCSCISTQGTVHVEVAPLDEVLNGAPVTFLKMDIEGVEMQALRGAAQTIRSQRPKLAICVYHRNEDIVEIPLYLQELCPDYRYVLRHYAFGPVETVLYAY